MTEHVVEAAGLSARFRDADGTGPLDLSVAAGERMLVLGPSGCGKSTLLRLLQGAIPQAIHAKAAGEVRIVGRDVRSHPIADLADVVGVVAQDPATGVCLPDVEDEVAFPLENLGVDPGGIPARVTRALTMVGADHLRGRDTTTLSGGEAQRVALAAATVTGPRVLLLDEPTAMLDAEGIASVRAALDEAGRESGAACILVEHRLDEFVEAGDGDLAERWLVLGRDGAPVFDGRPDEISAAVARSLLAEGCWLPFEIELLALTGAPTTVDDADLVDRLTALIEAVPGSYAVSGVGPDPSRSAPTLRAAGIDVVPGGARSAPVLRDVSLELRGGEVVALLGANGGGKSSLLHVLAGVAVPRAGTIDGPRPGLVFQNPEHQFGARTVHDEVALGLPAGSERRATAMLEQFDLTELSVRNPYTLSGGQKRRLSLAAMLVHDRPFLLADEPAFGLDRHAAIATMRALEDAARAGRGILFSSHDLRAVCTYADRVIVIADGGVAADVTPEELLRSFDLLDRARLRPSRLLRRLAAQDGCAVRTVLRTLDDLALSAVAEHTSAAHGVSRLAELGEAGA
ncbi:energy-coupling factor ABC transporter ATP-binding protein [Microbacterium aerolatum]|uniref:ABC transporter ATP-binding protein n=1 Tax=Microbacterium aerolatum TaxID=153731 RepID=UPI003851656C